MREIRTYGSEGGVAFGPFLPLFLDRDVDSLPDWWEYRFADQLERLSGIGLSDVDQDGLPDAEEYRLAVTRFPDLSPVNRDSDGDGLSDGDEVLGLEGRPRTDPTDVDSDADGLSDFVEKSFGVISSLLSAGTDPNESDSDGDGWDDRLEIIRQSSPVDWGSVLRRGLLGLWRFNQGRSLDSSLFQNHGILSNGSYSVDSPTGKVGDKSLRLSGDGMVRVPHDRSMNVVDQITMTAWVKPSGVEGWDAIVTKGPSDGSGFNHAGNYELRIEAGSRFLGFLHQQGWFEDTSFLPSLQPAIMPQQWSHVAITASTEGSGLVSYYVNGELVDVYPESIPVDRFPMNRNDLLIGNRADFFTGFDGLIDDVALFDRVLAQEEIEEIMAGGFESIDLYPKIPEIALRIERVSDSSDLTFRWESKSSELRVLESSLDLLTWGPVQFFNGSEVEREYRISSESDLVGPIFFRMFLR